MVDGVFALCFLAFAELAAAVLLFANSLCIGFGFGRHLMDWFPTLADFLLSYLRWEMLFPEKGELSFLPERDLSVGGKVQKNKNVENGNKQDGLFTQKRLLIGVPFVRVGGGGCCTPKQQQWWLAPVA